MALAKVAPVLEAVNATITSLLKGDANAAQVAGGRVLTSLRNAIDAFVVVEEGDASAVEQIDVTTPEGKKAVENAAQRVYTTGEKVILCIGVIATGACIMLVIFDKEKEAGLAGLVAGMCCNELLTQEERTNIDEALGNAAGAATASQQNSERDCAAATGAQLSDLRTKWRRSLQ